MADRLGPGGECPLGPEAVHQPARAEACRLARKAEGPRGQVAASPPAPVVACLQDQVVGDPLARVEAFRLVLAGGFQQAQVAECQPVRRHI